MTANQYRSALDKGIIYMTPKTYTGYVNNWITPNVGKLKLSAVTRLTVRTFRDDLLADKDLARITAKKILGAFKSALSHAVDCGEIKHDPGVRITIRLGGRHVSQRDIPEKEVFDRALKAAKKRFESGRGQDRAWLRYYPMLLILCYCGLRLSEVRGLPFDAVDHDAGTIEVRQRADRAGIIGPPKSVKARRVVHAPQIVLDAIKVWQEQQISASHTLLFPSASGAAQSPGNIRKRLWVPLNVGNYGLHVCRHFYASRRIECGDNLKELSEAMGHADPAFTLRVYGHLFKDKTALARRRARAEQMVLT